MKDTSEEVKVYDNFADDLSQGIDVVDRRTYEIIVDSRRKELIKYWLAGKKGLVLDYGCGDGSFSRFIKTDLKNDVIGVDLSGGMIRFASKKDEEVHYLIVNCHELPFRDESFDAIVAVGVFHHLDIKKSMSECKRLLRKKGFLVIFEPNSLCPLSFMGRRMFKTKIHTSTERPYNYWSFVSEIRANGFSKVELRFLSSFAFIFPFIWASKFAHLFNFLKKYAKILRIIDTHFEKIPLIKQFSWMFCCKCVS